jgi:transposase
MLICRRKSSMGRPTQMQVRPLTAQEEQELTRVAKATSVRADHRQRAQALLAMCASGSPSQAAQVAGYRSRQGVSLLVQRFNAQGLAALGIAAGRGRKATYTAAARSQMVACAQREPDREQDGGATWSLTLLQRTLRREGLARVSRDTVRRVLQEAGSSYQRTRTWCPTGTALRVRKSGVVQVVDPQTEEKKT